MNNTVAVPTVAEGDILFVKAYPGEAVAELPLRRHCKSHGVNLHVIRGVGSWAQAARGAKMIRDASLLVIWHGREPGGDWALDAARAHNTPFIYVENGLLPQQGNIHFDPRGIGSRSSLMGGLDWVADEDLADADRVLAEHFKTNGLTREAPEDFILVPLQLEADAAIYLDSPFTSMRELLEHVQTLHPGRRIVATPHPKARTALAQGVPGVEIDRKHDTIKLARTAAGVVGINSTVLYETAALGVPTTALGRCPLAVHTTPEARRKLIAAAIARQAPRAAQDLSKWLTRFAPKPA